VVSIEDRCESLIAFPDQGRSRDDLGPGIKILPYAGAAVIAYRFLNWRIEIVRVFAGGRDYESALKAEGKG
jgi:toxin ParE1/3/4